MSDINLQSEEQDILSEKCERAFLVGIQYPDMKEEEAEEHITELYSLVHTMGIEPIGHSLVKLRNPQPKYLIGTGKVEEILEEAKEVEADLIIFNDDLSPSQQRNWERNSQVTVIDRQEVILDIFADRAQTREAVLQVALARMEYSLPRLTRAWTHLSRQRGGTKGTRGEGETQLEIDRRIVLRKMDALKKELIKVQSSRAIQRKKRKARPVPTASIVGYTNAGKSSLLNTLTDSEVLAEDKLFATLDPTTRKVKLPLGQELLVTDTVGFIRKLPHSLVEAFKSTLEETVMADFLVHVLDGSNPEVLDHYKATMAVLGELGVNDKPTITVFNKLDKFQDDLIHKQMLQNEFPDALFISLHERLGLEELVKALEQKLSHTFQTEEYLFPHTRHDLVSLLHREAQILETEYLEAGTKVIAKVPIHLAAKLENYTFDF
ncbi:GTPase HflX [Spirochaeta cellobiosiphila]|uniref:GTPase HflX n=1 Tax=Spirochaeta cellobiosiphila TaxID=504483 RepID=UPI0003F5C87E|nr:GTPase HflX [Spirochaeta cellobiosiphila]